MKSLFRTFASGEITAELFGRIDSEKYQAGLALCRNFITLPHGPAVNRTGTEYVDTVKDSTKRVRLIPFAYSNAQTFAIEIGAGYFRWHTQGATLLAGTVAAWSNATNYTVGDLASSGGVNYYCIFAHINHAPPNATYWYAMPGSTYEIPNIYAEADLFDIHYSQSADVITLSHPSYPTMELNRLGATRWTLTQPSFDGYSVSAPGVVSLARTGTGATTYRYAVTALAQPHDVLEESLVSTEGTNTMTSNITGITQANPGVITTSAAHWLQVGDLVSIVNVVGMTQINNATYTVNTVPSATTFTVALSGTPLDTTAFGAYVSGGQAITLLNGVRNDLTTAGNKNTITWTAVSGALRYNVYKYSNGLWGYIGQAGTTSFEDTNIVPDISQTPPLSDATLTGSGNYPAAVGYFQQRRVLAGTVNRPLGVWATRTGPETRLSYSIPVRADDRIAYRVFAHEASSIRHIVPMQNLILLTESCELRDDPLNSAALPPTSISVRPQSYIGARNVTPVVVGNTILYAQSRGGRVRELAFQYAPSYGYVSNDISVYAPHLFDYSTIVDMAYSRAPVPILWCVSSTGDLLSATYMPEQEILAWHHHVTDGVFESVCTVTENNEDMLYCVVQRTINGVQKRYIARLHTRQFATLADAFFVDCGATYSGAPVSTVSGAPRLEGKTVSILADGAVQPQQVVTGGAFSLPAGVTASKITFGLPITADVQTLPLAMQIDGYGQGRPKNVNAVWLRVNRSSGIRVGPTFNALTEYKQRT